MADADPNDRAAEDAPAVPPGAVAGRGWHLLAIAGAVGLLVSAGVLLGLLGVTVALGAPGGGGEGYISASALLLGLAAGVVTMLLMH